MAALVSLEGVCKTYRVGEICIKALDDVGLDIERGEFVVVLGPSGAGKTTLLNIVGGMDSCDSGSVKVGGRDIARYGPRELTEYRRRDIGFVFQFYNLVANLTAIENVELASQIVEQPLDARDVLSRVGLADRMDNFPAQLSGGEQQRASIARAIAKNPTLLLCDEPTGALDYITGKSILALLSETCRGLGMTVLLITHNSAIASMADKIVKMKSGRIESVTRIASPAPVEAIEW
jgi:putative ABC transport system ATP-binding protein